MLVIDNTYLYSPEQNFPKDQIYHIGIKNGEIAVVEKGLYSGNAKKVINAKQKVACPSFTDSHLHLLRFGLMKAEFDLRVADSWKEVKRYLTNVQTQQDLDESDWLVGRGLTDNQYEDLGGLATAEDLDGIESRRPIFLLHKDGHECVVNTPALKRIKKKQGLPAEHKAFIETDNDGNWTGRFKDTAVHFIKFHFRNKNESEIDNALRHALPFLARSGITSVHSDDLNYAGDYNLVWNCYRALEKEGKLTVRAFLHHYVFNIGDMRNYIENEDRRTGDGTEKVRVGAFKIFADGTHRLHTAAMDEPYYDKPNTRGVLNYGQAELDKMVQLAEDNNMQVAMHCLGDRAVDTALNAIGQTKNAMRHRIIHAQTLSDELLKKMKKIKPCVETQPGFLLEEWNKYAKWLGEERGGYCGMGKSLQKAEVPFTLSSDSPIGPLNPMVNIFAGVNRTDKEGKPQGGWMPSEKIDIDTAFNAYSATPAYLEFKEDKKGVLKQGAKADFIMLRDHPDNFTPRELKDVKVQQTYLGGEKIFDRTEL